MNRLIPGTIITWNHVEYYLLDFVGLNKAILRNKITNQSAIAPINELKISNESENLIRQDLPLVSDVDWQKAWDKYLLIKPLLDLEKNERTLEQVENVAKKAKKNVATIYRWLNKLEETGRVSTLLRKPRNDIKKSRLENKTQEFIDDVISKFYLTSQRRSIAETCLEVQRLCFENEIVAPHPNTIRNRIQELSEKDVVSARFGSKIAREKFQPIRGSFPGADFPLAVVQMDHTPVDLILVDDKDRLPIGRPYLTIAIDCFSRMITGFYITLEAPGALSVGLCISHSIMTKDLWLAKFGISTPWPIWGKMRKIYVDNAKEFRGVMLERACQEHGIILEHRPKGLPNYGGHVERAFRTFMSKTHSVSGTTFSNVQHKNNYNSEKMASMTLSEFEHWFTIFIVQVYHQKSHKGISDIPPIKLYEQAILGTENSPGIGLPIPINNEEKLRLDFMPYVERTIQEYGVLIDNIHYYSDVLRVWIHARDEQNSKLKRKFIFARDPRDISVVYFLDPHSKNYVAVPYRDISRPPISLWELKAVIKRLEENEGLQPNEELIFDGIKRMREIEVLAIQKTKDAKTARRNKQRKVAWNKPIHKEETNIEKMDNEYDQYVGYPADQIKPFDEIEENL
ncbi:MULTISPECIES: Mu transposase C-terminal domain-containing protein [Acinetobacter]|uniref:Mu transposase C-terminal domain-containing protein n=1 Tax=Acinetobacter TaxID=469 RepID=UPI00141AEE4B|nr:MULTISPECIES: Mu transposase C-terminal domain-containing protein [Acinetobacter]MCS4299347.1 putative transposase [Acinetobacter guillouiae]MCW2252809.1 putative transposase [Acinetobacter sp. BIGb0204]NII35120.1 putative transposase [Acinetobacter sp. BIGb0196]